MHFNLIIIPLVLHNPNIESMNYLIPSPKGDINEKVKFYIFVFIQLLY